MDCLTSGILTFGTCWLFAVCLVSIIIFLHNYLQNVIDIFLNWSPKCGAVSVRLERKNISISFGFPEEFCLDFMTKWHPLAATDSTKPKCLVFQHIDRLRVTHSTAILGHFEHFIAKTLSFVIPAKSASKLAANSLIAKIPKQSVLIAGPCVSPTKNGGSLPKKSPFIGDTSLTNPNWLFVLSKRTFSPSASITCESPLSTA